MAKAKTVKCTCDGSSVECEGGSCGCHCTPTACVFTCGDTLDTGKLMAPIFVTSHDGHGHEEDNGKNEFGVKSNGLTLGLVARMIDAAYDGEVLVPIGRIREEITIEVSGSLEQICHQFGIALRPCKQLPVK